MKNKKALIISIVMFIIVAILALVIILNKGKIGSFSLVATTSNQEENQEDEEESIKPQLNVEFEKDYLAKKEKTDMTVTIDGETVTEGVEFESSDEKIAKINDDNQVVAVSTGRATIKAMYDGMEATKEIKVIVPIKSMSFTSTNSVIRVGKDLQMKLKISPSEASTETLKYTSSDESIATVNQNGIVTGISAGKVKITVYDSYTDTEKTVNLTIKK